MFYSFPTLAQVESVKGNFSVEYDRGCAPFTININVIDGAGDEVIRNYIYEIGGITTTDTFYTYSVPGEYLIYQIRSDEPKEDTLIVRVLEPTTPTFNYYYCNNTQISIEVTDTIYDFYDLFTPFDTVRLANNDTLPVPISIPSGDSVSVFLKGYFEGAEPNCGESPTETITLRELINTIEVLEYEMQYVCENEVSLEIIYEADSNTFYTIEYQDIADTYTEIYSGKLVDDTIFFDALSYDTSLGELCFRINAISTCDNDVVIGTSICEEINDDLTAFTFAYATYDTADQIVLNFSANDNGQFNAIKYVDEDSFKTIRNILPGHTDASVYPLRKYHYKLTFSPGCESSTQFQTVSAGNITPVSTSPNAYEIQWEEGLQKIDGDLIYQLIIASEDESLDTTISDPSSVNSINLSYRFGLKQKVWIVGNTDNNVSIRSNPLLLTYEYVVYIPTAFTPNGDGKNELLEIYGLPSDKFTFQIFDRWGRVVFMTSEVGDHWDGRQQNGNIIVGSYAYKIDFYNQDGELFTQHGSFAIVK
jgi:gliding motility-associated-like protein